MKRFSGFTLDTSNQCIWHKGAQLPLAPKPFAVLRYLIDNPGRLVTHDELLDALWPDTFVQPQVLRTYVLELRKLLGDDARQPRFIQSLPKRGYCFIATVIEGKHASTDEDPSAPPLVGRDSELASLVALSQLASEGRRQVVFVTGDSGIGKTAIVDALCRTFDPSRRFAMARGQCVQGVARREEYYPLMEALAGLCATDEGEQACAILGRVAPAWLAALGREAPSSAGPRGPGELCAAFEELAAQRPLMLILDDVHWADESTVGLISALARRRSPARILLLALANLKHPATAHSLRVLKQDLAMRSQCTEIELQPLAKPAVRELLSVTLAQTTLPADLDAFTLRHSEGNPLFVLALTKHLIGQQFLVRKQSGNESQWALNGSLAELEQEVPDELAQMIDLEVQALAPQDQRLLEAASIFTVAFPAWGVAAALQENPAAIEESIDALARRLSLVRRAGYDELPNGAPSAFYVFTHGQYREVLYQRQAPARRAERHNAFALHLATLFAGREAHVAREMAGHYEAAGNWLPAIRALQSAAQFASERQYQGVAEDLLQEAQRIAQNLAAPERTAIQREIQSLLASVDQNSAPRS